MDMLKDLAEIAGEEYKQITGEEYAPEGDCGE